MRAQRVWTWAAAAIVVMGPNTGIGAAGVERLTGTAQPAEDAALIAQLEEINARTVRIKDLSAQFEQRKYTPLLKNPMVSTGSVRVVGAVVRWDTARPEASVMRIDGRELRLYYPASRVVEVYPLAEDLRRLSSSPLPRLEQIRKQFAVARFHAKELDAGADTSTVVGVLLTPIVPEIREHVRQVRVVIDIAGGYATHMEITDADGERTAISFSKVRLNTGLTDRDVALDTPPGVKVVSPLSAGEPGEAR